MKKKNPDDRYMVPAVEQASRLLFCLAGSDSAYMGLIEICNETGINKSKAYSILHTFQKFGLIQRRVGGKGYALGPGLISLSRKVLDNFNIPMLAGSALKELAKKTGCTATLGLIAEDRVFVAAKYESSVNIGVTVRVGHNFPLTQGSHGKAIAAFLPADRLDELLQDEELFFHGTPDKLDITRLKDELEKCRAEGYALDLGEVTPGLNTVASPVIGPDCSPIGYIKLIGLFNTENAMLFGPMVAETGRVLSKQLGAWN